MSALVRGSVKADNSCLFAATARLCEGVEAEMPLKACARQLRAMCADAVLADPDPETRALMLGHESVDKYCDWIRMDHNWGGEPEVVMLASHFGVEVNVVSCESLSLLRYGAADGGDGAATKGSIYLLYTGQHYDPLLGEDGTLVFAAAAAGDAGAAAAAAAREAAGLDLARQHNKEAAERALEKRVNRLKCMGCGAILTDAAAFQEHCTAVEHDDDFAYDCEEVKITETVDSADAD